MSTTSIQLPFLHGDGISRACRHIAKAVRKRDDIAVLLVHVGGIEHLCAKLGHLRAGDVLNEFYKELRAIARQKDSIERLSDRKFAVLLYGLNNRGHVALAARKVRKLVKEKIANQVERSNVTVTIGVALCPEQGDDPHELMRAAEIASLGVRKTEEQLGFFETSAAEKMFLDWGLESRLVKAIASGELTLNYQPKVELSNDTVVGVEALMRWHEPEIGAISPEVFIDLAETTGHIVDLTEFAIQRTCRDLSRWLQIMPHLNAAVNITPSIIQTPEIVDVVRNASNIWGVSPQSLTMEVTENALMLDPKASHAVLTQLRDLGARVSIDDFGTGYSSLAYLKEIPADELKIDRTFVMGMLEDPDDYKIVDHTLSIAKSFGLSVVAEGIESKEMLDELRKLGCDYAQGYFLGRPAPAEDFEASISEAASAVKVTA